MTWRLNIFFWLLVINLLFVSISFLVNELYVNSFWILQYLIVNICAFLSLKHYKDPFTLHRVFHIFTIIFFGFIPLFDIYENRSYWGGLSLNERLGTITSLTVVLSIVSFEIGYRAKKKKPKSEISYNKSLDVIYDHHKVKLLVISCASFILFFNFLDKNFAALLFRGVFIQSVDYTNGSAINLIFTVFLRSLIPAAFFISLYSASKRRKIDRVIILLLGFIFFIGVTPTGIPRYMTAAFYLPLLIYFIPMHRNAFAISYCFLVGIILVMPALDLFRNVLTFSQMYFALSLEYFRLGHFDPYHNLNLVINEMDITYGFQLLTAMLFFIPKSIWTGKGIGSGSFVAEETHLYFDNISMPFVAEAFLNFGFIGVAAFCVILGYITSSIDKSYGSGGFFFVHRPLFYMHLSLFFFILRGDLMSAFAYTVGITLAYIGLILFLEVISSLKMKLTF